jgi:glycosyltransferase involved in cell wall biosynthesis
MPALSGIRRMFRLSALLINEYFYRLMTKKKSNVSIIIPTLNEAKNLPFALKSGEFADDIFVLDSGSADTTKMIAESAGAHFIYHPWEGYARQKNWGLNNLPITTDWVFILDADEMITPPLRDELISITTGITATGMTGFYVNRYFVWEGKKIRHCGYYPSWNLRFFRKSKAKYEDRDVHEHMLVDGAVGYLKEEMHHEDRRGRDYLWRKHLNYADLESREMIKIITGESTGGLKPSFLGNALERRRAVKERIWPLLPGRWALRFFYMYVLKLGFLDGAAGLDMCLFMTRYELEITRKLKLLRGKDK